MEAGWPPFQNNLRILALVKMLNLITDDGDDDIPLIVSDSHRFCGPAFSTFSYLEPLPCFMIWLVLQTLSKQYTRILGY